MSKLDLNVLIKTMIEQGASDLHLTVGAPPAFRINGAIIRSRTEPLVPDDTKRLCFSLLTESQRKKFETEKELDFSFGVKNVARLRANLFVQRGAVAGVFRRIPTEVAALSKLGFDPRVQKLADLNNGLVLVTGATGSGKSTTLAAFIDYINRNFRKHIITIEDPIEFTHEHRMSIVNQREIGVDCASFSTSLRQVLREDPDVILVGEMRDRETAQAALTAAETGHLVFSTLHTNGAIDALNRMIQMFPVDSQDHIRNLLSFTLEAVVTQCLCMRKDRKGRVMVYEYLKMTPAIRNLVRENKLHQVLGQMQIGQEEHGMITMNQSLAHLMDSGVVDLDEAMGNSPDPDELGRVLTSQRRRT